MTKKAENPCCGICGERVRKGERIMVADEGISHCDCKEELEVKDMPHCAKCGDRLDDGSAGYLDNKQYCDECYEEAERDKSIKKIRDKCPKLKLEVIENIIDESQEEAFNSDWVLVFGGYGEYQAVGCYDKEEIIQNIKEVACESRGEDIDFEVYHDGDKKKVTVKLQVTIE